MRKGLIYSTRSVLILLVLLTTLFFTSALGAQTQRALIGRSIFNINIRSAPGLNGAVLGSIQPGTDVKVVGRTPENNWVQVDYNGITGWTAAWLMVFDADTLFLDITTSNQPAPSGSGGPFGVSSPYNVNVRSAPDANASLVMVLPFGTEAEATGRTDANNWVRVRYNGTEGWVAAWLVILQSDIAALPIGENLGVIPPTATPTAGPGTPTATPRATATPSSTPESSTTSPTGITISSPYRINVRTEPSVNSSIVAVLPFSSSFAAVGRNAGNNWVQIDAGATKGWVAAWVITASANTIDLPITSDSTEIEPFPGSILARSTANVNVRNDPTSNSATNTVIQAGGEALVLGRTTTSDWLFVEYNGVQGWVAAWVVLTTADMNNLPVR